MELSVVIPAYNEEKNIASTLREVTGYLTVALPPDKWEIIVVDDGSADATNVLTKEFISRYPENYNIRLLKNEINSGKGAAVRKGMLSAKGETRLFMDADNATRIPELEKMLPFAKSGYGIVIGSRKLKGSSIREKQPFLRRLFGQAHHLMVELVLGLKMSDFNCGFKCFNAAAADIIFKKQRFNGWVFDAEILFIAKHNNIKVKEVPIEWEHKATSKVRILRDTINSLKGILIIRLNHLRGFYN
jgi:dolichyl-phosphate beta-glucosyltransferase